MLTKALIGVVFALTAVLASPAFAQTTSRAVSGAYTSAESRVGSSAAMRWIRIGAHIVDH